MHVLFTKRYEGCFLMTIFSWIQKSSYEQSYNVDDVRYAYFQEHYAPNGNNYPLEKIKAVNPCSMPPCNAVRKNQILRANYMAYIWKNATLRNPTVQRPEGHGWILIYESYQIEWFDCDQVPRIICQVIELVLFMSNTDI